MENLEFKYEVKAEFTKPMAACSFEPEDATPRIAFESREDMRLPFNVYVKGNWIGLGLVTKYDGNLVSYVVFGPESWTIDLAGNLVPDRMHEDGFFSCEDFRGLSNTQLIAYYEQIVELGEEHIEARIKENIYNEASFVGECKNMLNTSSCLYEHTKLFQEAGKSQYEAELFVNLQREIARLNDGRLGHVYMAVSSWQADLAIELKKTDVTTSAGVIKAMALQECQEFSPSTMELIKNAIELIGRINYRDSWL